MRLQIRVVLLGTGMLRESRAILRGPGTLADVTEVEVGGQHDGVSGNAGSELR